MRKCGSSTRKGLLRNGRRQAVARSSAGHAQASTVTAETGRWLPRSIVASVCTLVSMAFVFMLHDRTQWDGGLTKGRHNLNHSLRAAVLVTAFLVDGQHRF